MNLSSSVWRMWAQKLLTRGRAGANVHCGGSEGRLPTSEASSSHHGTLFPARASELGGSGRRVVCAHGCTRRCVRMLAAGVFPSVEGALRIVAAVLSTEVGKWHRVKVLLVASGPQRLPGGGELNKPAGEIVGDTAGLTHLLLRGNSPVKCGRCISFWLLKGVRMGRRHDELALDPSYFPFRKTASTTCYGFGFFPVVVPLCTDLHFVGKLSVKKIFPARWQTDDNRNCFGSQLVDSVEEAAGTTASGTFRITPSPSRCGQLPPHRTSPTIVRYHRALRRILRPLTIALHGVLALFLSGRLFSTIYNSPSCLCSPSGCPSNPSPSSSLATVRSELSNHPCSIPLRSTALATLTIKPCSPPLFCGYLLSLLRSLTLLPLPQQLVLPIPAFVADTVWQPRFSSPPSLPREIHLPLRSQLHVTL